MMKNLLFPVLVVLFSGLAIAQVQTPPPPPAAPGAPMPPPPGPGAAPKATKAPVAAKKNDCQALKSEALRVAGDANEAIEKPALANEEEKKNFDWVKDGVNIDVTSTKSIMTKIFGQRRIVSPEVMKDLMTQTDAFTKKKADLSAPLASLNTMNKDNAMWARCSADDLAKLKSEMGILKAKVPEWKKEAVAFVTSARKTRDAIPLVAPPQGDEASRKRGLAWVCTYIDGLLAKGQLSKVKGQRTFTSADLVSALARDRSEMFGGNTKNVDPSPKAVSPQEVAKRQNASSIRPNVEKWMKQFGSSVQEDCKVTITGM